MQGKQLTESEHKAVLLDRGFLVNSTVYSTPLGPVATLKPFKPYTCWLQALQLLNTEYAQAARYLEQARAEHANLDGVQFPIGAPCSRYN